MKVWLEDLHPGDTHEFGARRIERDEIIAFGTQFDPQPFHLGDEPVPFGGLIASGCTRRR